MSTERIERAFARLRDQQRTALVVYLTIGDPSLEESLACALAAVEAGADILELGVPFSDPTADGPVIAAASYRAIQRGGSLKKTLAIAARLRERVDVPLVLFSYYNPVVSFGPARLPQVAVEHGVDGLLLVDLPPEEGADLRAAADAAGLAIVPLVAPTSGPERVTQVVSRAKGFVYYVSLTGVTGSGEAPLEQAGQAARAVRERSGLPVVVGFGISSPEQARLVANQGVDGVVVGTAVVKAIAGADPGDRERAVRELVSSLRSGLDARQAT